MKFIQPIDISLISSTIPESDAPEWEIDRIYATGESVLSPITAAGWTRRLGNVAGGSFMDADNNGTDLFMAVSRQPNRVVTSPDGAIWTQVTNPTEENAIAKNEAVAFGSPDATDTWVIAQGRQIFSSTNNGATWALRHTNSFSTYNEYYGVYYSNNLFVCVGRRGQIVTSPDGIIWTARTSGLSSSDTDYSGSLTVVRYADTKWVAAGGNNVILYSSDATTWTAASTDFTADGGHIHALAHDGTNWIAGTTSRKIATSSDGTTWTVSTGVTMSSGVYTLVYADSLLMAGLVNGKVSVSSDGGAVWEVTDTDFDTTDAAVRRVSFMGSTFVAFGQSENISTTTSAALSAERRLGIYESLINENEALVPRENITSWQYIGSSNKYRMFDQYTISKTTAETQIIFEVDGSTVTSCAMFGLDANTVTFELVEDGSTIYTKEEDLVYNNQSVSWSEYFFNEFEKKENIYVEFDAISYDCTLKVTIDGTGFIECGKVIIGKSKPIGLTQMGPVASITDFSRVEDDDFGRTTLIQRNFAKRMEVSAWLETNASSSVQKALAGIRATPTAWLGDNDVGIDALLVYGIFQDFQIVIARNAPSLSEARLEIRGMI